ncbi:hypothetical protein [Lentibacillus salicampi]
MEQTKKPTVLQKVIRDRRAVKKHYNDKPVAEETIMELLRDAV